MISALTKLATTHPRRVLLAAAVVGLVSCGVGLPLTAELGSSPQDFQDPSSQYERANRAVEAATGQRAAYETAVLVRARRGLATDAATLRAARRLASMLAVQRGFERVLDYGQAGSGPGSRALLSRDGREMALLVAFASDEQASAAVSRVRSAISRPPMSALFAPTSVRFGGGSQVNQELNELTTSELARAELLALPILLALSFWFFRGLLAALLPPLVGGLAILITFLALGAIDQVTPVSVFALNLVSGMGLGLGIDYSLFVLSRYREELAQGRSSPEALARTMQTVGRTVLFSCLTVAAALLSLLVFPLRFLYSMGIGGAVVTLSAGAAALLVLPALLIVLGPRIDALSPAWLQRRAARSATATSQGAWWRLAHGVVRRPSPVAALSAVLLLAAATPALHVRFTSPAGDLLPPTAESRQVEDALAARFPANVGEATEIVLRGRRSAALALVAKAAAASGRLASVAAPEDLGRGTWRIALLPDGSPYSNAQQRLLSRLRALARPYGALVSGATAFFADQKAAVAARIPLALLILLALTAAFLFAMTGSLTIPLKALVMNALSVSVGTGLLVWIFQDGHLASPLGFRAIGGLEESTLVLMVVVAFALATDYEVFVLARVKEAHDDGLPNREAIALGIERTGRIITAAALLFCVAIGALATSELFFTKQLGVGAALTVAIDASVIRALLVPSLMALMGDWNWWAPAPLRRLHDRMGLSEPLVTELS